MYIKIAKEMLKKKNNVSKSIEAKDTSQKFIKYSGITFTRFFLTSVQFSNIETQLRITITKR